MSKNKGKINFSDSNKGLTSQATVHATTPVPTGIIAAGNEVEFTGLLVDAEGNVLDPSPRALYCTGAGTVYLSDVNGVEVPYPVPFGMILPFEGCIKIGSLTDIDIIPWW